MPQSEIKHQIAFREWASRENFIFKDPRGFSDDCASEETHSPADTAIVLDLVADRLERQAKSYREASLLNRQLADGF